MNWIIYVESGIYQIHCIKTNKTYIGESQNILERLSTHVGNLNRFTHDCLELQADWSKYGKEYFTIEVLYIGPEWQNSVKRIAKQDECITNLPLHQRYNPNPSNNGIYRQILKIDNSIFPSIASAAKALEVSETTIRRRLNSVKYPNYIRKEAQTGRPISIDGVLYPSIEMVIEQKLAKDRFQVLRRLNSANSKWQGWVYIDEDNEAYGYVQTAGRLCAVPASILPVLAARYLPKQWAYICFVIIQITVASGFFIHTQTNDINVAYTGAVYVHTQ